MAMIDKIAILKQVLTLVIKIIDFVVEHREETVINA